MKFNPQLKLALEASQKASVPPPKPPSDPIKPFPVFPQYSARERVVSGQIRWKPIDKTAALVIAKAPWWAFAPSEPPKDDPKPQRQEKKTMKDSYHMDNKSHHNSEIRDTAAGTQILRDKSNTEMSHELAAKFAKDSVITMTKSAQLLEQALDARAAMDVMVEQWKSSWIDFQQSADERIRDFRMRRQAWDTETRQLMASLREVRQFFLDKSYETEVTRLREFVELCERLQRLKASGFLDTVADTMLKLAGT